MGSVIKLSNKINNSYLELKKSVEDKLVMVDERIEQKLQSNVDLVKKMSSYHLDTGGKKLRALITLGTSKLCGYYKGSRDVNFAACVELIHSATLMHDDVIDNGELRRGKKTLNKIWGNQSSILIGDYLLSRCFEMMVEDGNLEILKLLSSTSALISQGEILQLQHRGDVDMLEETYLKIISNKTAALFLAAAKIAPILTEKENKYKDALESYGKNLGLTFQIADDTLDYHSDLNIFGKNIGNDFFEGKVTLPIILLFQKINENEKKLLKDFFIKESRTEGDLRKVLLLIKNHNIINECYKKAEHYINLASNSLNIFQNSTEKDILKNLTTFSLERNF
jgi:octaprenyl-diphosphate synthase